jgi:hypothetical protein
MPGISPVDSSWYGTTVTVTGAFWNGLKAGATELLYKTSIPVAWVTGQSEFEGMANALLFPANKLLFYAIQKSAMIPLFVWAISFNKEVNHATGKLYGRRKKHVSTITILLSRRTNHATV